MISASRKVDLGVLLMANLPEYGDQEFRSLQDVARQNNLSASFLGQLMMGLKKAKLVLAKEGVHGGYQLARSSSTIRLSEIYEALEGPLRLTNCLDVDKSCACERSCLTKGMWAELQGVMNDYLNQKKLSDFR